MSAPSVFKRTGRKNYYTSIDGHVVSTSCSDQYSATLIAKQMKEVGLAAYRQGKRTLGEYLYDLIELHLKYLEEVDRRGKEHIRHKRTQLMKPINDGVFTKLKEVRKQTFEPWWNALSCGAKTRREYMTSWNVFLDWLVYEGKLNENPIKGKIRPPRVKKSDKKPRRAYSEKEMIRLLSVAGKYELLYLIAYVTGARKGELKQLEWPNVHECDSDPYILLRPVSTKNDNGRKQYITLEAAGMLAEARGQAKTPSVFPMMPGHHTVDKHIKLAGIPKQSDEGIVCVTRSPQPSPR